MRKPNRAVSSTDQTQGSTLKIGAVDQIENDRMNMAATALALAELIATIEAPFTIAIRGDWGTGKSSIINMTRSLFATPAPHVKTKKNKSSIASEDDSPKSEQTDYNEFRSKWANKVAVAQFNPWADSELVRTSRASTLLIERFIRTLRQNKFIPKTLAKSLLVKLGRPTARFAAGSLMSLFGGSSRALDSEIDMSSMSARLDEAVYADTLRNDLTDALLDRKLGDRRIVFFIDDLDRIDPDNAVHILDTITSLLSMPRCIFVIAVDQNVLMRGVESRFQDKTYARNYFDKTFNLSVKLSHTLSAREIKGLFKDRLKIGEKHKSVPLPVQPIIEQCAFGNPRSLKKLMWLAHFRSEEMRNAFAPKASETDDVPEAAVASALAAVENAYPKFHREIYSPDISDQDHWDLLERALNNKPQDGEEDGDEQLADDIIERVNRKRAAIDKALELPEAVEPAPSNETMADAAIVIKAQFHSLISQLVERNREDQEAKREETSQDHDSSIVDNELPTSETVYQHRRRSGWMATYVSSQLVSERKRFGYQYSYPQSIGRYMARRWSFSSIYVSNYAGYLGDVINGYVSHIGANGFDLWVSAENTDLQTITLLQEWLDKLTLNAEYLRSSVEFTKHSFPVGTKGQHGTHSIYEVPNDPEYVYLAGWKFSSPLDTYEQFEEQYDLVSEVLTDAIELVSEVLDDRLE